MLRLRLLGGTIDRAINSATVRAQMDEDLERYKLQKDETELDAAEKEF